MTAVVADVEGVLSPPAFARDILHPYVRERLGGFLADNATRPEVAVLVADAARDAGLPGLSTEEAATVFEAWMDAGLNVTTLLTLQGMIADAGYRAGELRGRIYDDAAEALARWQDAGVPIYVYSETPAPTQKLLLQFSDYGDLTPRFAGWLDTVIGAVADPGTYRRIARVTLREPERIVFLSRNAGAIAAAHEAGVRSVWIVRADAAAPSAAQPPCHLRADSLAGLDPEALVG